jgi:hypothetical protein
MLKPPSYCQILRIQQYKLISYIISTQMAHKTLSAARHLSLSTSRVPTIFRRSTPKTHIIHKKTCQTENDHRLHTSAHGGSHRPYGWLRHYPGAGYSPGTALVIRTTGHSNVPCGGAGVCRAAPRGGTRPTEDPRANLREPKSRAALQASEALGLAPFRSAETGEPVSRRSRLTARRRGLVPRRLQPEGGSARKRPAVDAETVQTAMVICTTGHSNVPCGGDGAPPSRRKVIGRAI